MLPDIQPNLSPTSSTGFNRKQWLALIAVSLGVLMIVIDGTAVAITLPLIKAEFAVSQLSVVWMVNAFLVTNGGFLLLGSRLGDLYGHRRIFLYGLILLGMTSLWCGLATSWLPLLSARLLQGFSAAIVETVAVSLIIDVFPHSSDRAKALGVYSFILASGGALGLLLSGTLTSVLGWRSIFLLNVPLTALVYSLCTTLLPRSTMTNAHQPLDVAGALAITTSLSLAVLAIVRIGADSWSSPLTVTLLLVSFACLIAFLIIETRSSAPLVPLHIFQISGLVICSLIAALFSVAIVAGIFTTFYLQWVLRYSQLQVSFVYLLPTLVMAAFSLGLSARLVNRFGVKQPLAAGMLTMALGLALLVRMPTQGNIATDLIPGLLLLNVGAGASGSPMLLAATSGVRARETGLATGIFTTASVVGAALGLAILASIAASHTNKLLRSGMDTSTALTEGYHQAFLIGAITAAIAALIVIAVPLSDSRSPSPSIEV